MNGSSSGVRLLQARGLSMGKAWNWQRAHVATKLKFRRTEPQGNGVRQGQEPGRKSWAGEQYPHAAGSGAARSLRHTDLSPSALAVTCRVNQDLQTRPFHGCSLSACSGQTLRTALGESGEQNEFRAHVEPTF